jgi:hypothetical protein
MTTRIGAGALLLTLALASTACTGGSETNAAEEPKKTAQTEAAAVQQRIDARRELESISKAIPIYHGAQFNPDLSKRDEVMVRNQFGPNAEVYTLATDDSFPQVYHYYTTYLGQFGGYQPHDTYPPKQQNWRNLEVQLNQAMQDPFIPGQSLDPNGRQVTLQIAETEAEPKTVIRYVVTPYAAPAAPPAPPVAAAATPATPQPVTR